MFVNSVNKLENSCDVCTFVNNGQYLSGSNLY
jgi:hypothetical protein